MTLSLRAERFDFNLFDLKLAVEKASFVDRLNNKTFFDYYGRQLRSLFRLQSSHFETEASHSSSLQTTERFSSA